MAIVRRKFVNAICIDFVLLSHLLLAAILHSTSKHSDGNSEMAPFIMHAGHALTATIGSIGVQISSVSFPSRVLSLSAIPTFFADTVAVVWHTSMGMSDHTSLGECLVYAIISGMLAISSLHVYWRATAEFRTFGTLLHAHNYNGLYQQGSDKQVA